MNKKPWEQLAPTTQDLLLLIYPDKKAYETAEEIPQLIRLILAADFYLGQPLEIIYLIEAHGLEMSDIQEDPEVAFVITIASFLQQEGPYQKDLSRHKYITMKLTPETQRILRELYQS